MSRTRKLDVKMRVYDPSLPRLAGPIPWAGSVEKPVSLRLAGSVMDEAQRQGRELVFLVSGPDREQAAAIIEELLATPTEVLEATVYKVNPLEFGVRRLLGIEEGGDKPWKRSEQ